MVRMLVFGLLVGGGIGLLGSRIDILVWHLMGRPAVLVREGWESIHIAMVFGGGLMAGLAYGVILGVTIDRAGLRKNIAFILATTFVVAAAISAGGAFLSIAAKHIAPWVCGYMAIFLAALVIARLRAGPASSSKGTNRDTRDGP